MVAKDPKVTKAESQKAARATTAARSVAARVHIPHHMMEPSSVGGINTGAQAEIQR